MTKRADLPEYIDSMVKFLAKNCNSSIGQSINSYMDVWRERMPEFRAKRTEEGLKP